MRREETLSGFIHPETIAGRVVWSDSSTSPGQLADKLRFGDPTRGWEGDERLALCFEPELERWEVWRLDHNSYHLVAVKPADQPLDERIIDRLMAHDSRRGFNIGNAVVANNEAVSASRARAAEEERTELFDQLRFHARKEGL